jgi:hypothetical protein
MRPLRWHGAMLRELPRLYKGRVMTYARTRAESYWRRHAEGPRSGIDAIEDIVREVIEDCALEAEAMAKPVTSAISTRSLINGALYDAAIRIRALAATKETPTTPEPGPPIRDIAGMGQAVPPADPPQPCAAWCGASNYNPGGSFEHTPTVYGYRAWCSPACRDAGHPQGPK